MSEQIIPVATAPETASLTELVTLRGGGYAATFNSARATPGLEDLGVWAAADLLYITDALAADGDMVPLFNANAQTGYNVHMVEALALSNGSVATGLTTSFVLFGESFSSVFTLMSRYRSVGVLERDAYSDVYWYDLETLSQLDDSVVAFGHRVYDDWYVDSRPAMIEYVLYDQGNGDILQEFTLPWPTRDGETVLREVSNSELIAHPSAGWIAVQAYGDFIAVRPVALDGTVSTDTVFLDGYHGAHDIQMHPDGSIVMLTADGDGAPLLLRIGPDGAVLGEVELSLDLDGTPSAAFDLSITERGLILVAGRAGHDITFREFSVDLTPITDTAQLNDTTTSAGAPQITSDGAGNAVAGWTVSDGEGLAMTPVTLDTGGEILGTAAGEWLFGTTADDTLRGWTGDDILVGGTGADLLDGGAGVDFVWYAGSLHRVLADLGAPENNGGGALGDVYVGIENLHGSWRTADTLRGDDANNLLNGSAQSDRLYGRAGDDTLFGSAGADVLFGNQGADLLTGDGLLYGDKGDILLTDRPVVLRDRFIYFNAADSRPGAGNRDIITDFYAPLDRIEISRIDADITQGFRQDFTFIAEADFSGAAGELRFESGDGMTLVQADRDGDMLSDFEIELAGAMTLTADNFLL